MLPVYVKLILRIKIHKKTILNFTNFLRSTKCILRNVSYLFRNLFTRTIFAPFIPLSFSAQFLTIHTFFKFSLYLFNLFFFRFVLAAYLLLQSMHFLLYERSGGMDLFHKLRYHCIPNLLSLSSQQEIEGGYGLLLFFCATVVPSECIVVVQAH